jgi:hypothetical protein
VYWIPPVKVFTSLTYFELSLLQVKQEMERETSNRLGPTHSTRLNKQSIHYCVLFRAPTRVALFLTLSTCLEEKCD